LPNIKQVNEYLKSDNTTDEIISYFKSGKQKGIRKIRKHISKIDNRVPLYDIYSANLFLIQRDKVYYKVVYWHHRFPNQNLFNYLQLRYLDLTSIFKPDKITTRQIRKLKYALDFLNNFDLKILENTYVQVFYYYANEVGKNITTCTRPSFLPHFYHINPYYTRSEIINMGLNMGLIKSNNEYYDTDKINQLCQLIRKEDINADILLKHQQHIISDNKVGLVQYYTLQGSYFMNQYLRNLVSYNYRNVYLENLIRIMWELINTAPAFDKPYILYRFIKTDAHIRSLKIGDEYIEQGFTSTTRDPFYRSDIFKFGFILIKIKIPANEIGVALCLETLSHFPHEEEILLSPLSRLMIKHCIITLIIIMLIKLKPDMNSLMLVRRKYNSLINLYIHKNYN